MDRLSKMDYNLLAKQNDRSINKQIIELTKDEYGGNSFKSFLNKK